MPRRLNRSYEPKRKNQHAASPSVASERACPNQLIANSAVGVFPSVQPISEPIVWRPVQQRKLDEAVAAGLWRPLFDENATLIVQQRDDGT